MVQDAVRTASPIDVTTPWWAFGTESPRGCRRSPRAGAVPRPLPGRAHRRQVESLDDPVADGADALDGHLHHVTGPQRRGGGRPAGAPPPAHGSPPAPAGQPPLPQVPEPSTSPARTSVPREA